MSERIHELLDRNLQEVFGEGDPARRRAAIQELYNEQRPVCAENLQADATEDEGAHDPLPELRLRDEQCPELVRRADQGFHRSLRVIVDQSRSARQLR